MWSPKTYYGLNNGLGAGDSYGAGGDEPEENKDRVGKHLKF